MIILNSPSSSPLFYKALEIKKRLFQGCNILMFGLDQDNYIVNMILRSTFLFGNPNHARLIFYQVEEPNTYVLNTTSLDFDVLSAGLDFDVFVKTSLLCIYARCGCLNEAHRLFNEMPTRNVVSWTAIISGYIKAGRFSEAVDLFKKMLEMELMPDSFTLVRLLSACSQLGDLKTGEWIHSYIREMGTNVFVATSLLDMYCKCGSMERARGVFDEMVDKDLVCWGAMINGYASNGLPKEALELFSHMQRDKVKPDYFTFVGVLSACARLGALELGEKFSCLIDKNELSLNPILGTALIDMYAKCGSITRAWRTFQGMMERDLVLWNAVISGLAMNGHVKSAFGLFAQMEKMGIRPDGNTIIGILCGCTHAGLVDEGRRYFDSIQRIYSLIPRIEHYGCMVDLLSRGGLLVEAHQLILDMPFKANAVVWGALLGGCRLHKDTQLAEHVLKQLIELEPWNSGNYVLLSNIFSVTGRWDDAENLRLIMNERGLQKTPGCSWIEMDGVVHEFRVGDQSHPLSAKMYMKLDELSTELKPLGYKPKTDFVLFDIEEEEKEHSLGCHSEKLAISFGLISTAPGTLIRVVKNLRVCGDCHTAITLISKITGREIIV